MRSCAAGTRGKTFAGSPVGASSQGNRVKRSVAGTSRRQLEGAVATVRDFELYRSGQTPPATHYALGRFRRCLQEAQERISSSLEHVWPLGLIVGEAPADEGLGLNNSCEARRGKGTLEERASFETTGLAGKSTFRAPRRMVSSRRMASYTQASSSCPGRLRILARTVAIPASYRGRTVADHTAFGRKSRRRTTRRPACVISTEHLKRNRNSKTCTPWTRSSAARSLSESTQEADTSTCRRLERSIPGPPSRLPPPSLLTTQSR